MQELPNWRTVAHPRDLLMACGVLPAVDKQLLHAQTWLHHRLTALAGNPHLQLLRQFGLWHQLPRLRARARMRPLTEAARRFAGEQFTQAERFLIWLDQGDRHLGGCTQADLDTWHAGAADHHKRNLRAFLTWAISAHHMPNVALATLRARAGERLTQTRRLWKRAGQPLHARTLLPLIHQLGIPAQATRLAALRQLVLQAPAPVIADALGYHDKHVAKVWTDAGGNWKTYAPGDHSR